MIPAFECSGIFWMVLYLKCSLSLYSAPWSSCLSLLLRSFFWLNCHTDENFWVSLTGSASFFLQCFSVSDLLLVRLSSPSFAINIICSWFSYTYLLPEILSWAHISRNFWDLPLCVAYRKLTVSRSQTQAHCFLPQTYYFFSFLFY